MTRMSFPKSLRAFGTHDSLLGSAKARFVLSRGSFTSTALAVSHIRHFDFTNLEMNMTSCPCMATHIGGPLVTMPTRLP
jgi:hypothetical protein